MRKTLLITVLVLFGCALLWLAGSAFVSSVTSTLARQQWPEGLGSTDSVPGRFPSTETNDAARALIPIAARLGVGIAPDSHSRGPQNGSFSDQVSSYVSGQAAREDDSVEPPPAALGAFIAAHDNDFVLLENIVQHSPIVWVTQIDAGRDAPIPNLLGYMQLNRLLVARALARHGDPAGWSDLQTSWILGRGLMQRPEIISTLVGLSMARATNAVARFLPVPAPEWRDNMAQFDYGRAVIASQQAFAWSLMARASGHSFLADEEGNRGDLNPFRVAASAVLDPYVHYAAAGLANSSRESAVKLASMTQCSMDGEAFDRGLSNQIPRWELLTRVRNPNLGLAWQRMLRFRAELEGTNRILELKTLGWPASLPGVERSQCSDAHWIYDGHSLGFSKDLPVPRVIPSWQLSSRAVKPVPLRFTSARTPPASDLRVRKPRIRLVRAAQPAMRIAG